MKKKRLFMVGLITAAILTACSKDPNSLYTISQEAEYELNSEYLTMSDDQILNMNNFINIKAGDIVNYDYIINSELTGEDELLKLIDDKTITSTIDVTNSKIPMTEGTFESYKYYVVPNTINPTAYALADLVEYEINCKRFVNNKGEVYYLINETADFTDYLSSINAMDVNGSLGGHLDEPIEAISLYKYDDGLSELIAFNQKGFGSDANNVKNANEKYAFDGELIIPITEEIKESLDKKNFIL